MTAVVRLEEVLPTRQLPEHPVAHVAVLVSLNFPDLDEPVAALVRRFTRVALETLVELGASFELLDTSTPLPDPGVAARAAGRGGRGGGGHAGGCYG